MSPSAREKSPASLRWLSRDYSALRAVEDTEGKPYDVLIIGSGYGGAMAAVELAGREVEEGGSRRKARICVLERGKEYAPGMFASSLQELPPHVRMHRSTQDKTTGPLDALLDVRIGPDVCTLVGSGLGGGSLINAGVMETPRLDDCPRLPGTLVAALTPKFFEEVKTQLGASTGLADRPGMPPGGLPKTAALRELALAAGVNGQGRPLEFRPAAITVQVSEDPDDPEVPPCTLCGDCMTGCNVGAKKSLDTTLLRQAWRQGAEIYTGGSVLKIREHRDDDRRPLWAATTVYTDESMRRRHRPMEIWARRIILAAGTLGSTEILLRSRTHTLPLSHKLGEQFSCNGDNLVALHEGPQDAHPVAQEHEPLRERMVGPTITSVIDLDGMLLEEFAVPAPLKRLFEETVTTARLLQDLEKPPKDSGRAAGACDSFAVDAQAMERTLLVGVISHDEGSGQILLPDPKRVDDSRHVEGRIRIQWPGIRTSFMLDRGYDIARALVAKARGEAAPFLPNPLWRLLPRKMESLIKGERGPVLTVHPLGGCPMGSTHLDGVVDEYGRVFDPKGRPVQGEQPVHEGLVVLDGSIIPGSLGANPALMISAVAKRAARKLAMDWRLHAPQRMPLDSEGTRPVYREPEHCTPAQPVPTEVELAERLAGPAGKYRLELTLTYKPASVAQLMSSARRKLEVDPARSFLRVYQGDEGTKNMLVTASEPKRDDAALLVARVDGELDLLRQEPGDPARTALAAWSWFVNRGTRELWDRWFSRTADPQKLDFRDFLPSAQRAAEVRCFDYRVRVGDILKPPPDGSTLLARGDQVHGQKRLTYGLCSNPWSQLTQMKLTRTPAALGRGVLELDGRFLAKQGFPLIRITRQENQVVALAELASWAACWARMLLSIHLWSFRAPDVAPTGPRRLLPAADKGRLPAPQITELELDAPRRGVPVRLRLTRYAGKGSPVVLIHGYSASGSTYTHDAIPMPLALYLLRRGHDVWVLDLRTSAGMPSAVVPWHFEDAALADIPVAIAHIARVTGKEVNVFAHCIGAAMLSMALLCNPDDLACFEQVDVADGGARPKRYPAELKALKANLGRIVLSQKAPTLVYTDQNVLRAYFMRILRRAILPEDYQFTVPTSQGVAGGLMDRLLATIPYPDDEFRRENPFFPPWKRTPWAGFRHRMDALYARDFSLKNVTDETLASIHDLFGPLNLDTVAQAIHFARYNTITDGAGRAIDTQRDTLAARWPGHGTLSLHGTDNGLAHVRTLAEFERYMNEAGVPFEALPIEGYGHQDCLIGRRAALDVFPCIADYLERRHDDPALVPVATPA